MWNKNTTKPTRSRALERTTIAVVCVLLLLGVTQDGRAANPTLEVPKFSEEAVGDPPNPPWQFFGLARQTKPKTRFSIIALDGTRVLQVDADHSYGNLGVVGKHELTRQTTLAWRWDLEIPNLKADVRKRAGDDAPLKVCVSFEYDTSGLSLTQKTELALARSNFPGPVPVATLCYIWDHRLPVGTELANAFTDRIHFIVAESGEERLHSWVSEKRNVADDFWRSFGKEFRPKVPDELPEISGVLVGADADNTELITQGEIGDITLSN
jgi:hypothetical protein